MDYLEKELGRDDVHEMARCWMRMITYKRTKEDIAEYVSEAELRWKATETSGQLSEKVKAL